MTACVARRARQLEVRLPFPRALEEWHVRAMGGTLTLCEMQDDAKVSLGVDVPFDWEVCRTVEGYYRQAHRARPSVLNPSP